MTSFPIPSCEKHCKLTVEILYFYRAVHAHRMRLFGLYELIQREIPDMFQPWREEGHLIKGYLYLHDLPKIQGLAQLREHGYSSEHTLCCRLGRFYGKNKSQLSSQELQNLEAAITDLNEIERRQKDQLLRGILLYADEEKRREFSKFITWLERVIDVTDTELSRAEEMGIKPSLFGATHFLQQRGEKEAAELSFQLESRLQGNHKIPSKFTVH